jgi:hypothetical protein
MRQVNKYLFLLLLAITLSCEPVNYIDKIVAVDIYESSIPKNGTLNQDIDLELKAQATNGCYNDLKIKLIETEDRHYLLKATARFKSYGYCPEVMVYIDTIITFRPTKTGKYFFQINETPFEIRRDTIEVN